MSDKKQLRWKFLNQDGKKIVSAHGKLSWQVGKWNSVIGTVELCNRGLHCSDQIYQAFSYVQGSILARVEVAGRHDDQEDKQAWSEMRIVKAYKWTKKDSVALSIFAAELCVDEFEKLYPDDKRPRQAIEAARAVLLHDTEANRSAAESAESAARSAARSAESAARSAARSAESAARSAWSAAWSAARSAWSAARSARSAAWSAAESAAWSAAESAAWSAAESAAKERTLQKIEKWMQDHIKDMEQL